METKLASKRTLWALYLASKNAGEPKDFREMNLTQEEANELLTKYNERTGYVKTSKFSKPEPQTKSKQEILEERIKGDFISFFREKYLDRYIKKLSGVLKQVSVVEDDVNTTEKKYIFFGSGCSVAWLKYRKCKKYETIYDVCRSTLHNECFNLICQQVGYEVCNRLEKLGSPLTAILYQDYSCNQLNMWCVKEFLEMNGAKNVRVEIWYD